MATAQDSRYRPESSPCCPDIRAAAPAQFPPPAPPETPGQCFSPLPAAPDTKESSPDLQSVCSTISAPLGSPLPSILSADLHTKSCWLPPHASGCCTPPTSPTSRWFPLSAAPGRFPATPRSASLAGNRSPVAPRCPCAPASSVRPDP